MYDLTYAITLFLLIGMPLAMEVGRRVRHAQRKKSAADPDAAESGVGALDAAVYALFGLLLAFAFSGAANRFDDRRALVTEEANAIGTAHLRLDLLPHETQVALRPLFREYLEARIATFRMMSEPEAARAAHLRSVELQGEIWRAAVAGARDTANPAVLSLVLPALNEMIDITTSRLAATQTHPPQIIFLMLVAVAFAASFLSGMAMAKSPTRPWPHIVAFTLVISVTVFVIIDIEHPRRGFIKVDSADQVLIELRDTLR